jgi:sec-independent protein translocase protein TatC
VFFFIISVFYKESLLYFLVKINLFQNKTFFPYFIYTHLTEVFNTYILLAFISAIYLSFPIILIHLLHFISPGLYSFEFILFKKFIFISLFVWILNNFFTYYFLVPLTWNYFCYFDSNSLQGPLSLYFEAKLNEYVDFLIYLYALTNLLSQIFFFIYLFALNYNSFDLIFVNKSRKYLYLLIFIFASILTPPDVISQFFFAIPLLVLSEIIIIFSLLKNEYLKF